jgi:small subunit ribosomal protein S8
MLTRIRNAILAKHDRIQMPFSKMKENIVKILHNEGRISNYKVVMIDDKKTLVIDLKYYSKHKESVIRGLKRVSKPGRRVYADVKRIPRVWKGMGMAIVSTSHGILTDELCRIKNIGGEILCYVW